MDDHHRERVDPVKRIIDDIGLTTRNGEWTKWCYIVKRGGEGSRGQDWLFSFIYSLGSLSLRPPFCKPISFRSFPSSFFFLSRSNFFLVRFFLSISFLAHRLLFLKFRGYAHARRTLKVNGTFRYTIDRYSFS